jgi:hypothetical protein
MENAAQQNKNQIEDKGMYLTVSSSFSNFRGLDEETLLADYLPGPCKMQFMFCCNPGFHLLDKLRALFRDLQ